MMVFTPPPVPLVRVLRLGGAVTAHLTPPQWRHTAWTTWARFYVPAMPWMPSDRGYYCLQWGRLEVRVYDSEPDLFEWRGTKAP